MKLEARRNKGERVARRDAARSLVGNPASTVTKQGGPLIHCTLVAAKLMVGSVEMPLLDVRNLSVTFATRRGPLRAVDGIDITVEPNEVLAIVGESGSGKSVAMLAVMGLLPWTASVTADSMNFDD